MIRQEARRYIRGLNKLEEFYDIEDFDLHDGEIDEFSYNAKTGLTMLIWHQCTYIRMRFWGNMTIKMEDSEFPSGYVSPNSTISDLDVGIDSTSTWPIHAWFNLIGIRVSAENMEIVNVYSDPKYDNDENKKKK